MSTVSDITVASLAATPGIGYIGLTWTYSDPRSGALPNLALDMVEVWGSTTNDRATAAKVAEGITSARHSGVANGVTWYYWIKARDYLPSAQGGPGYGPFHPTSTTAGVSGTEATATQVTLSGLTAVSNVSQVSLQWAITDPSTTGLGYLGLAAVEVWAASTNDRAGASKVTEGLTSAVHDGIPEGETRYYWVRPRNRNGTFGSFYPSGSTSGVASTARDQVGLNFGLANGKIVASVSSNALTIAIKTAAGNDPSASDPVFVAFRNATLSTGDYVIRSLTSALSLTIPSGKAFSSNNELFRLWWSLFDTGSGLKLAVSRQHQSGIIVPLDEYGLRSASDISSVAYNLGTLFADATITSKPCRTLGYTEWTTGLTDATLWATAPQIVQMLGPGVKLPGDSVGLRPNNSGGSTTGGSVIDIPYDDTAPQSTEGSVFLSVGYTPKSGANALKISGDIHLTRSTAGPLIVAIFRDDVSTPIDIALQNAAADTLTTVRHSVLIQADKASSITFDQRYGATGGATVYFGATSAGRKFGGYLSSKLVVEEFMG